MRLKGYEWLNTESANISSECCLDVTRVLLECQNSFELLLLNAQEEPNKCISLCLIGIAKAPTINGAFLFHSILYLFLIHGWFFLAIRFFLREAERGHS
jgi:hypothetical protein